ncbi:MAG: hypothetical protein EBS55_13825 [Flavobacteriaceae bacterium]|nr:hypothetical protein [Flavobacteriaceae bacterium]
MAWQHVAVLIGAHLPAAGKRNRKLIGNAQLAKPLTEAGGVGGVVGAARVCGVDVGCGGSALRAIWVDKEAQAYRSWLLDNVVVVARRIECVTYGVLEAACHLEAKVLLGLKTEALQGPR